MYGLFEKAKFLTRKENVFTSGTCVNPENSLNKEKMKLYITYRNIGWFTTRHLAHKYIFLRSDSNPAYFSTSIGKGSFFFLLRASFVIKYFFD